VIDIGTEVDGVRIGDRVVINPMAAPSGAIGNGGASGALADLLLVEDAQLGVRYAVRCDGILTAPTPNRASNRARVRRITKSSLGFDRSVYSPMTSKAVSRHRGS